MQEKRPGRNFPGHRESKKALRANASVCGVVGQFMGVRHLLALGFVLHGAEGVAVGKGLAAGRADDLVFHVTAYRGIIDLLVIALLGFERPGLNRTVDLTQVVDTGVHLRGRTGFHEVGNGNGRQQANDGHDDHDLDQGEAALPGCLDLHC